MVVDVGGGSGRGYGSPEAAAGLGPIRPDHHLGCRAARRRLPPAYLHPHGGSIPVSVDDTGTGAANQLP